MSIEQEHWATELEQGDRVLVTIRHATDGTKNLHNQNAIVIENRPEKISCYVAVGSATYLIPYNEMTKP
jgi:predicted NUDIX family phosphoesterase